jgi:hypothetical protein
MGEQHDQRDLAHVGGFAAHVGAGDQQHAAHIAEARVVGDEGVDLAFDDGVASFPDLQPVFVAKRRCTVVEAARGVGKGAEAVEQRDGAGNALQRCDRCGERFQQLLVELLLQRQCAVVGRQRLVLEGLELRRDVALGVFQRLPTPVVVGNFRRVGVADLDVEAVHLVELDAQRGDAAAGAFARFELQQELAAVGLDTAQLVQIGRIAGGDHATFAQHDGGFGLDRRLQQRKAFLRRFQVAVHAGEQR